MDLWVVAAAAGAGYVARHCKSLVKGRQGFSYSSCSSPSRRAIGSSIIDREVKDRDSCPCSLEHCDRGCGTMSSDVERLFFSYSEGQNRVICTECAGSCTCSGIPCYRDVLETRARDDVGEGDCGDSGLPSTRETVAYGFRRKKKRGLRSRRTNAQLYKPVNSLESCLMAQLYKGQTEVEDYTCASMTPPSSPTVGPYSVTNGSSVGKSAGNSFSSSVGAGKERRQNVFTSGDKGTVLGVPQLPSVGSVEHQSKGKSRIKLEQGVEEKHQMQGFSQGSLLFCMGLSIGLASSVLNNKREINDLSNLLKQTESLVQDLQEELEMKDSLTVKELTVEDCEAQDTQNDSCANEPFTSLSTHEKLDVRQTGNNTQKVEEESFSLIEAELEAELERLELSIRSSGLDSRMLNQTETNADYVPHAVKGDLNPDVLGGVGGSLPYADRDGSGSSTPPPVHHAVSPRELTLRLHGVIQSRLEKRVEELENALQNSQMKLRYMKSQNVGYLRELSNRKSRHSFIKADDPVVINLSGESLDDDFTKINDLDEEEEKIWQSDDEMLVMPFDERLMSNGFLTHETEDDDEAYDEMEELLIKQIVEQARKGSPVVLNAQRALSSPDENEHSHEGIGIDFAASKLFS